MKDEKKKKKVNPDGEINNGKVLMIKVQLSTATVHHNWRVVKGFNIS